MSLNDKDSAHAPAVRAAASGRQTFSLLTLTAMVVGSMVGAGIFSLPVTFGRATGPFGAIIAWIIAGSGMLMLAFVFQILAQRKPHLDAGIFAYAKAGFGNYLGFAAAFGFWFGTCLGNTTYFILIMSTLGRFFRFSAILSASRALASNPASRGGVRMSGSRPCSTSSGCSACSCW